MAPPLPAGRTALTMHSVDNIAFVASQTPEAQEALERLKQRYPHVPPATADVIVALGGDGFMLETLHATINRRPAIYGMNRGTVGFLMNAYREDGLIERLRDASPVRLHPLRMRATTANGATVEALAINEVALLRQSRQAAKLRISVDGKVRLEEMICDGVLVCSSAGSTAYNASAHGPILPIGANVMAVTPISAFRPRRWRGAVLPDTAEVVIEVNETDKRPVSVAADFTEVRDVVRVEVKERRRISLTLLFDPEHNLEERILNEQFSP
ncbi:NAD(+) kinase [Rhodospirillum rubrum ATCC 11170]|uniref:NAD kinase n=2 Tax=Rhodospirillum rubrum TaxID=1085 RepID=Q2RX24_RHORT|nr:NAD(+) kinase [Rhodospirillum rubrum ATCC 11170]MBK5952908.1 NAD kinase [Rhodospirillum rubrum]HAP98976.1 NAD kinase [Rhodospirillum rubrum]HCF19394.1 NAD kinase [Rhodospirillum rubrum]